jgi:diguanylate cyclase (GGDEF)-like protein
MPGSRAAQVCPTTRTRRAAITRTGVTLAVYHASADVEPHLASLRRSKRFTLACFPQHSGPLDLATAGFDGVLWELGRRSPLDRRHLGTIARRLPVVSYSTEDGQDMTTQSQRAGFRSHLTAPLEPKAVERGLRGAARAEGLSSRLREFLRGLARSGRRAEVLDALVRALTTTRVPERMASSIVDLALDWFGGEAWALLVVREAGSLHWIADRGVLHGQRAAMTEAAGRAASCAKIAWTSDTSAAARARSRSRVSIVALPVRTHGRAVAALVGLDRRPATRPEEPPARDDARLAPLLDLTDVIGGPLDTALRLQRANARSLIDDLTGLYNSRFLDGTLRREVKRSVRTGRPLSVLFVDLDGFKGINDRYGHLCGSRALVEAAERISSGARETDIVARFGGDEFALILPDTGREGAMLVAQRVRECVAGHPFLAGEGIGYRLTASVGVSTLPDTASTPEMLLAAADTAMYRVKGRGKDGIEMATLVQPSEQT